MLETICISCGIREPSLFPNGSEPGNPCSGLSLNYMAVAQRRLPKVGSGLPFPYSPKPYTFSLVNTHNSCKWVTRYSFSIFPYKLYTLPDRGPVCHPQHYSPGHCVSRTWHSTWHLEAFNKYLLDVEWTDGHYHLIKHIVIGYSYVPAAF